ncbi:MAG TPA: hypothetical protein VJM32_05430 [Candidatus Saccharimonadales bacterium]|nr:hypothetical protein [Candidatus Saccharimonadales bacterium]
MRMSKPARRLIVSGIALFVAPPWLKKLAVAAIISNVASLLAKDGKQRDSGR